MCLNLRFVTWRVCDTKCMTRLSAVPQSQTFPCSILFARARAAIIRYFRIAYYIANVCACGDVYMQLAQFHINNIRIKYVHLYWDNLSTQSSAHTIHTHTQSTQVAKHLETCSRSCTSLFDYQSASNKHVPLYTAPPPKRPSSVLCSSTAELVVSRVRSQKYFYPLYRQPNFPQIYVPWVCFELCILCIG